MTTVSSSARSKIKRAYSHIDTLIRESTSLPKDMYEITNGPGRSHALLAQPDGFYLTYRPKEPLHDHFGSIIGDTVNNLRESMDYWVNAVLLALRRGRKAHFPFSEEWKNLETSRHYPLVKKTFPELADFILEEVKPCRDANLHLWAATSLCNHNKHNDFVPTIPTINIMTLNVRFGTSRLQNCGVIGDANNPLHIIVCDTPITIDKNFSATFEIKFPKGAVFEDQPVIPTLTQMAQVVSKTLDALDKFVSPYLRG